jgi:hypothetical protein
MVVVPCWLVPVMTRSRLEMGVAGVGVWARRAITVGMPVRDANAVQASEGPLFGSHATARSKNANDDTAERQSRTVLRAR